MQSGIPPDARKNAKLLSKLQNQMAGTNGFEMMYKAAKDYEAAIARGEKDLGRFDFSVSPACYRCHMPIMSEKARVLNRLLMRDLYENNTLY